MRKRKIKNLSFSLDLFGLNIDVTPFRWAAFALKTEWSILGRKQSTQLFAGPLHIWTFPHEGKLSLRFEIGLTGSVHGTFNPSGDNAIPYFYKKWTGRGWSELKEKRLQDLIASGNNPEFAQRLVTDEFGE